MFLSAALLLLASPQLPASPPDPAQGFVERLRKTVARDYQVVPREITRITEDTLAEDTAANKGDLTLNRDKAWKNLDYQAPGLRVLAFELEAGETLTLRHRRNLDLLLTSLMNTAPTGPMHDAINLVNKQSPDRRNRFLKIKNLTGKPFTVFVRINGPCNAAYQLEILREKQA